MHRTTIIPHQNISALPYMMVVKALLVNMGKEAIEYCIALVLVQFQNAIHAVEI